MGLDVGTIRNGLLSVRTVHTYLSVQLTGSTVVPYLVLRNRCHTEDVVVLATKIRLENGNDHIMEKKKAMTAVRSKGKLLRWKQETGEIRNRCNILGYSSKKW